jgi:hypothetical protein
MTAHRWSGPERDYLLHLAGDVPGPLVTLLYNRWARANGYPIRTLQALRMKAEKSSCSLMAIGTWLTTGNVAKLLGLPLHVPHRWTQLYPKILRPYQPPARRGASKRGRIYIRRAHLRTLARQQPDLFGGIPEPRLVCLLEDPILAAAIAGTYPERPASRQPKPVRCIETGDVFPSRRAAARAHFVAECSISHATTQRRATAAGLHWQEVAA